jgi:hypothetical protein
MNNAWFVSFLMWVLDLIDDILDDQVLDCSFGQ